MDFLKNIMVWRCILLCLVVIDVSVHTLQNLALYKPTNQSSTHGVGISSLAVDGCLVQIYGCGSNTCGKMFDATCCTHQALGQSYAWWSVDLGQLSEVSHIVVYFRWEYSIVNLQRTLGYIIRVSNDSDPQSGEVCFNGTGNNMNIDKGIRNHPTCTNITGRHVHFTNTKPDGYEALLELCEVQVFGCPVGKYGQQCALNCSSSCLGGRCDLFMGTCLDCSSNQYISKTGVCSECQNSCVLCKNYEGCINCRDTFYLQLNNTDKFCRQCPKSCTQCEKYKGCNKCFDSFYLENNICEPCSANCTLCSGRNVCSKCKDGFYLENSVCNACGDRCVKCNSSMLCVGCETGYFMLNGKCKSCSDNCMDCYNENMCYQCNDNYFKDNTGKCLVCSENCYNCSIEGCSAVRNLNKMTEQTIGTYIGGAVGGIAALFAIIVLIVLFLVKKRKKNFEKKEDSSPYMEANLPRKSNSYDRIIQYENESGSKKEDTYYNMGPIGIPVSRFKKMVETMLSNNATIIKDEFKTYQQTAELPCETAKLDRNKEKNRFKQIFAYEHSRVVLRNDQQHGYINANFIDGVEKSKAYIATQGPKSNTLDDFWFMIWQENCEKIVMLTNLMEGKKSKCEKYWPEEGHLRNLTHFKIRLLREREYAFYVIRSIGLMQKTTHQEREIQQFHFTAWPDHGTPEAIEIVLFHRRIVQYPSTQLGPMCVHCSAGVGRTGTFIGFDALLSNAKTTGFVDVPGYLKIMRKNRMYMIQNEEQYIALHAILLEGFNVEDTLIQKSIFPVTFNALRTSGSLLEEYKKLESLNPHIDANKSLTTLLQLNDAQTNDTLPSTSGEKYRINSQSKTIDNGNKLHAINVPSYRSRKGFIVTKFPTSDTLEDFWNMLIKYNCKTLVALVEQNDLDSLKQVMPTDQPYKTEKLDIQTKWNDEKEQIDIRIMSKKPKCNSEVKMFCNECCNAKVPLQEKMTQILKLAEKVDSREQEKGSNSSTAILSSDGSHKAGVFCLLYNTRNQLKMDDEVDVFQAARQLQIRDSSLISSFEEYEFCYIALHEYINMTDVYMNT